MPIPQTSAPPGDAEYLFPDSSGSPLGAYQQAAGSRTPFALDYSLWLGSDVLVSASYTCSPGTFPALSVTGSRVSNGAQLSFLVSGGLTDVTYNITITARTRSGAFKVDSFVMQVVPPPAIGQGWPQRPPGCDPGWPPAPCPPAPQGDLSYANVATAVDANGDLIVINPRPRYTVSTIAPQNPNLFDKWYNPADGCVYDWVTDGGSSFWLSSVQATPAIPNFFDLANAPTGDISVGDRWFNKTEGVLYTYVYDGVGYLWIST